MKKIKELYWDIEYKIIGILEDLDTKKLMKKYKEWDSDYWVGDLQYIWGVKSGDDLSGFDSNINTMNDIELLYNHRTGMYSLNIETAYIFKENRYVSECNYLTELLNAFTEFMDINNYSKFEEPFFFMHNPNINMTAETISELYMQFKIYVNGYKLLSDNMKWKFYKQKGEL